MAWPRKANRRNARNNISEKPKDNKVTIIVAIIGLFGVISAAVIANWDKWKPPPANTNVSTPTPTITTTKDDEAKTNATYLSTLIGKEPFSEELPKPLASSGFSDVQINDPSAAQRLNAVQIKLSLNPKIARVLDPESGFSDLETFAHIEVYESKQDALERSKARRASLVKRYPNGVGIEPPTNETFCINGDPDFWTCAGSRGFAYAEVTLSPGSNANLGIATGTLSAMLRYADKMTKLATNQAE